MSHFVRYERERSEQNYFRPQFLIRNFKHFLIEFNEKWIKINYLNFSAKIQKLASLANIFPIFSPTLPIRVFILVATFVHKQSYQPSYVSAKASFFVVVVFVVNIEHFRTFNKIICFHAHNQKRTFQRVFHLLFRNNEIEFTKKYSYHKKKTKLRKKISKE